VRLPTVSRDVTSFASEGAIRSYADAAATKFTNVNQGYQIKRDFHEALPQIGVRFNLDARQQVFANVAKNFRAPANFAFTGANVRFVGA
ncbi:hypothetical protein, partial [Shewanella algae]|uniref:hypothetical protein n=1 Tax=Shewanella algae TaxID=38313 RepID=UPI00313D937F